MTNSAINYEKVSLIYDVFLDHIDYADWADYIMEIADLHGYEANSICDMACGTGSFLAEMAKKGLDCQGVELSADMVAVAKKKYATAPIVFTTGNMLTATLPSNVDLITCLFDSLNYCNSISSFTEFINNSAKNLNANGVLIFDAVSQKSCKEHFFDYTEKDDVNGIQYERHCTYDVIKNIQHSKFSFEIDGKSYEENHSQYIYSFDDIQSAIAASEMTLLAAYSDFSEEALDRYTERAHFVLGFSK
jgi:2-polyprenyl-3-methyl-5-hydroxy-6-metoxy-1,4-benzoquinol methylase